MPDELISARRALALQPCPKRIATRLCSTGMAFRSLTDTRDRRDHRLAHAPRAHIGPAFKLAARHAAAYPADSPGKP